MRDKGRARGERGSGWKGGGEKEGVGKGERVGGGEGEREIERQSH